MGPFIIIALAILLISIVISVCAYPFICASIAVASKRYNGIAAVFLLILTVFVYILACTTLEKSFDNWCYSLYAGIVLTPLALYISNGLEEPAKWPESGEKLQHHKIMIPLLSLVTSLCFAIEGVMRMTHSYSVHRMLNYGWENPDTDSYRLYYEEFHYAGSLLFFVSLFIALIILAGLFSSYKEYQRMLSVKAKKISRLERIQRDVNRVTQKLELDLHFLMSFESQQVDEVILRYKYFCKMIVAALESSDEKTKLSYEYSPFNNIDTSYKVLLLSNKSRSYYFYPMGIVTRDSNDAYKYIPYGNDTVSVNIVKKDKREALPSDIRPIRQYWQHSCLDGSPDLRYRYNPITYVYEYGFLCIVELILHVYRVNTGKDAMSAYKKMYSYISQLKLRNQNVIMIALPEEKTTASSIVTENSESITKVEKPEEIKTTKQYVAIENPKTLEDCFGVILIKHGKDILNDNNLVSIITLYKEVDISEYKDVLDEMVREGFLYQFTKPEKQNDYTLYNLSGSFARQKKMNAPKVLFITQTLVAAIKKLKK